MYGARLSAEVEAKTPRDSEEQVKQMWEQLRPIRRGYTFWPFLQGDRLATLSAVKIEKTCRAGGSSLDTIPADVVFTLL